MNKNKHIKTDIMNFKLDGLVRYGVVINSTQTSVYVQRRFPRTEQGDITSFDTFKSKGKNVAGHPIHEVELMIVPKAEFNPVRMVQNLMYGMYVKESWIRNT